MNIHHLFPLCIIGVLTTGFLSNDMYLPSLPTLVKEFDVGENWMQLTVTAWYIGAMVFQLVLGPLSDFYGRKPVLMGSILLLFWASLLCGGVHTYTCLLLGRFFQGAAVSGLIIASFAATYETYAFSEKKITQMLGYICMSASLSPILGPIIGGYLATYLAWNLSFYLVSLLSLIFLFMLWIFIPESNQTIFEAKWNWKKVFSNYQSLITDRQFMISISTYGFMSFTGGAFVTSLAFIAVDLYGVLQQHVGWIFSPLILSYMLGAGLIGYIVKYVNGKKIIFIALLIASIAMFFFVIGTLSMSLSLWMTLLPIAIYYLCMGFSAPPLNNLSLSYSKSHKGGGAALMTFSMMLGCALGSLSISLVYNGKLAPIAMTLAFGVFAATWCYWSFLKNNKMNQEESI